jgi:Peptidase family M28
MKKIALASLLSLIITSCAVKIPVAKSDDVVVNYMNTINAKDLKTDLSFIASDETEGRETGSTGQKKAGKYIVNVYKQLGIPFPKGAENYYQKVPATYMNKFQAENLPDSENIWAFIEGSEKPNEVLVISAHYDHIGIDENGKICNGADDDGSGTSALLEIAQAFQQAKKEGHGPKRSILFLHVTGEEHGLFGSQYYSENPLFPIKNTITDINIDMIGRRDDRHPNTNNYIYIIGSDYLSSDLYTITENANSCYTKLDLDYKFNDRKDPNRYYYRSDHYNFAKNGIPSVFLFNGVHDDYHKESDEVSKIEFDALAKRTQLAFAMAWELANRSKRPVVDKKG